jgi:hypothetical protein
MFAPVSFLTKQRQQHSVMKASLFRIDLRIVAIGYLGCRWFLRLRESA